MQRDAHPLKPTSEDIARLAYLIWDKEGRPQGCDVKHWCEAESLLMAATRKELKSLHNATTREHLQHPGTSRKESDSRVRQFASEIAA